MVDPGPHSDRVAGLGGTDARRDGSEVSAEGRHNDFSGRDDPRQE